MELSRQEYWSGLPFPSPGDLPDPGVEHASPALQVVSRIVGRFFTSEPVGKPTVVCGIHPHRASLVAQSLKRLPARRETRVQPLGQEDPLEKEMATHSSILAWKIPWTEEPGRLQSMGSQRVRHD